MLVIANLAFNTLLSFTVSIIGLVLVGIILINHRQPAARLLCLSLFSLTYSILLIFLFDSQYLIYAPYLFRTGGLVAYLIMPSFYLYITFLLHDRKKLQLRDAIHLLPAIIYVVDFGPFFLESNESKRTLLSHMFIRPQLVLMFNEGWLVPSNWHNMLRNGVSLIYFFYLGRLLFMPAHYKNFTVKRNVLDWLRISTAIYLLLTIVGFITIALLPAAPAWPFTVLSIMAIFLVMSLILFMAPHILYGEFDTATAAPLQQVKNKPAPLPVQFSQQIGERLGTFITNQQFLRKNLKLEEVAKELEVKPYVLSAYINQAYQLHFNDLINHYRIQYIKEGLIRDEWSELTLEAIAEKAGFNNRNTFLSAFKKVTGMTPTNFMRNHRGEPLRKPPDQDETLPRF